MKKNVRSNWPELAVTLFYAVCILGISFFHEPWFDEAQAWEIARCESYARLLFFIPHYEGHPPLWHIILSIPAKLGVPFELGLKTIGFFICLLSVYLIEFKSPFPRAVKLLLPCNYFIFYQYGVIVRPYSLLVLGLILAAVTFQKRNERPWRFVIVLAFICETSAYGLAVAGGIAACWLFEIVKECGISLRTYRQDKRIYAMAVLLLFALMLTASILPAKDASFIGAWERKNTFFARFLTLLTTWLSETLIVNTVFNNDHMALTSVDLSFRALWGSVIIQALIVIILITYSNRKNLKYLVIPYVCISIFGATVFMGAHHLGVSFIVLLFWLWINTAGENRFEIGKMLGKKLCFTEKDRVLLRKFGIAFCTLCLLVPTFWTLKSAVQEIRCQYSFGRETYRFLKETGLENAKIAVMWDEDGAEPDDPKYYESIDTRGSGWPVSLNAYARRNIAYNFNDGLDNVGYIQYIACSPEENRQTVERWQKNGVPEVLLGPVNVELLTDNTLTIRDYSPIFEMEQNHIWKGSKFKVIQFVFLRSDLLQSYGLTPIERPDGVYGDMEFKVTDEMREQFNSGVDIDDILKPYLDYLFGEENGE